MLAMVLAALRSVHGAETIDQELSLYYVANEIAQTYHGMMIAIPEDEWRVFSRMRPAEMVATLRELAQKVRLKAYRKPLGDRRSPAETRGYHPNIPCLHRQTAQESNNQCGDALTRLGYAPTVTLCQGSPYGTILAEAVAHRMLLRLSCSLTEEYMISQPRKRLSP